MFSNRILMFTDWIAFMVIMLSYHAQSGTFNVVCCAHGLTITILMQS